MIVPMASVIVAVQEKRRDRVLEVLQDLGVLHVRPFGEPVDDRVRQLAAKKDLLEKAAFILSGEKGEDAEAPRPPALADALDAARRVIDLDQERQRLAATVSRLEGQIENYGFLGEADPGDFDFLARHGITARLYALKEKELGRINVPFARAGRIKDRVLVLAADKDDFTLPFEPLPLPEKSLAEMREDAAAARVRIREISENLSAMKSWGKGFPAAAKGLEGKLDFARAAAGMEAEAPAGFLMGFCPVEDLDRLADAAEKHHFAFQATDPADPMEVPTKLKNPRPVRIIRPVLDFMGTLPGYEEQDPSFWFLASMVLFFGMLVGDGGYGILFLIALFLLRKKYPAAPQEPFVLGTVFSLAAVAWGLASGTWFGVESLAALPGLKEAVIGKIASFGGDNRFLMRLCFIIGGVHMTVAHLMRIRMLGRDWRALSEAGWIALVWYLYLLAGYFVLQDPLPGWSPWLLAAGAVFAAGFYNFQQPYARSVVLGFLDLPLSLIRAFSDVISYVRLFAVGYATLVVAASFNAMAAKIAASGGVMIAAAALVLLIGHGMNIALALMGVVVHGVRLNMLEFSSHMQLYWTGTQYRPFTKGESS